MRTGALILGILGGIAGIVGSVIAFLLGGAGAVFGAEWADSIIGRSGIAMILSILGMVGGGLASARPRTAGILMLIAGIGGPIAISFAYIIATLFFVPGGIIALLLRKEK